MAGVPGTVTPTKRSTMTGDRRRYTREACLISAHVRLGKRIYEGTITNVCEDGAFVATQAPFPEDTSIQLRFRHPRTDATVKARAVVARRIRPGQGQMGLGVRLIDDLSSLEEEAGAVASNSGTWSRPEAVSHSGTWSRVELEKASATSSGAIPTVDDISTSFDGVERRKPRRVRSPRLRVRLKAAGELPSTGIVLDAAEGGCSIATDRPPKVGRLVRLELDNHGGVREPQIELTGKVIWRREDTAVDGSPRAFGVQILHFAGSENRLRYGLFLTFLEDRERNIITVR